MPETNLNAPITASYPILLPRRWPWPEIFSSAQIINTDPAKLTKNPNRTIGVVEIGSKSIRRAGYNHNFLTRKTAWRRDHTNQPCHLGTGLSANHVRLDRKVIEEAEETLSGFKTELAANPPHLLAVVGTGALRRVQHTDQGQRDIA